MTQLINPYNLEIHLKTIIKSDWGKLFELIHVLEKTNSFGKIKSDDKLEDGTMIFPYMVSSKVIDDFYQIAHELKIVLDFDWMDWQKGKDILNNNETNYSELNNITLCKLITVIIRADRFNEGYMVSCFENGIVLKILKGIKSNLIKTN